MNESGKGKKRKMVGLELVVVMSGDNRALCVFGFGRTVL